MVHVQQKRSKSPQQIVVTCYADADVSTSLLPAKKDYLSFTRNRAPGRIQDYLINLLSRSND